MFGGIVKCPPGVRILLVLDVVSFVPNSCVLLCLYFTSWQFMLGVLLCLKRVLHLDLKFLILLWNSCIYLWIVANDILHWIGLLSTWRLFDSWMFWLQTAPNPFPPVPLNVSDMMWNLLLKVFGPSASYFACEWYIVN